MLLSHMQKCSFQHLAQAFLLTGRVGTKEAAPQFSKKIKKKDMVVPHVVPSWAPTIPFPSSDGLWLEAIHVEAWKWSSLAYITSTAFL